MPKIYLPDNQIQDQTDYNKFNDIRRKFLSALYILLSEEPANFTILIAWILFVVHGILDETNFNLLKNHSSNSDLLDNLPWHSNEMESIKTWIPEVFLCFTTQNTQRQFSIFKLKSYLNHFYCGLFKSYGFNVTRDSSSPSGVRLDSLFDHQNITELFCCSYFPTIVVHLKESLCIKLKDITDNRLVTFKLKDGENFAVIGTGSLVVDASSKRLVTLQCFRDPNEPNSRISYLFERTIKYFQEDVFRGFNENPVSDVAQYYTMGNFPPKVTEKFVRTIPPEILSDDNIPAGYISVETHELSFFDRNIVKHTNKNMNRNLDESVTIEQSLGCLLIEENNTRKIMTSEKIDFRFVVQRPIGSMEQESLQPTKKRSYISNNSGDPNQKNYYDDTD